MASHHEILPHLVANLNRFLSTNLEPPATVPEPEELLFLETMVSFHTGSHWDALVPRTPEIYASILSEFVTMVATLRTVLEVTDFQIINNKVIYNFDETVGRYILEIFEVDDAYPIANLLFRVGESVSIVLKNPVPRFQRIFLVHLPAEVITIMVDLMDDISGYRFTRTCRAFVSKSLARMHRRAHFRVRYNNSVLHAGSSIHTNELYLEVLHAMTSASVRTVLSIADFRTTCRSAHLVRTVSIDNEWPRLWPPFVARQALFQHGTSDEIYGPLYSALISLLQNATVTHLRLVSLALTDLLTLRIALNPAITRLTLERPITVYEVGDTRFLTFHKMYLIRELTLGLVPETFWHASMWSTFALCPHLRSLFVFVCDLNLAASSQPVHYPFYHPAFSHIHSLHSLHIHGSHPMIENLVYWLATAAIARGGPGSLRRFKLHSYGVLDHEEVFWLVSILGHYHPQLQTLVIEGLGHVHSYLFDHIRTSLVHLEGLTIVRRLTTTRLGDSLLNWNQPAYEYASALNGYTTLRHLQLNIPWANPTLSPLALDALLDGESATSSGSSEATSAEDDILRDEGIALARLFAANVHQSAPERLDYFQRRLQSVAETEPQRLEPNRSVHLA